MTQFDFTKNKFFTALTLESAISRSRRRVLRIISTVGILILLIPFFYIALQQYIGILPLFPVAGAKILGMILLMLGIRLFIFAIDRFFNSMTFDKRGQTPSENMAQRFNYFAAQIWFYGVYKKNTPSLLLLLTSLPETEIGINTIIRLGATLEEYNDFLADYKRETAPFSIDSLPHLEQIPAERDITAGDLFAFLFETDPNFHEFMLAKQADQEAVRKAAQWVELIFTHEDEQRRWWSREHLGHVPGIAKTWAYGPTFTLQQFAVDMRTQVNQSKPLALRGREREVKLLEQALLKQANANVLIVGEPGAGKETILLGLAQMILRGKIFPELESKRVYRLSGPALTATSKTKGETEALLIRVLNEASLAGDIILVIEQFPEFTESLEKIGVIPSQILEPYLASSTLHIIAMADTVPFRTHIENNSALMAHFEKIEVLEPDESHLLSILMDITPQIEGLARGSVIVTYTGLRKIAEAGVRYLVDGALPQRAISLLQELVNYAGGRRIRLIGPELVLEYVGKKTKIPLGPITKEEQDKLINLEEKLHERVINQVEAISAIANTIRRARAGIAEPKRPIGSFLFLGPTGVGKTETAKALASVYFGNDDAMIRFDMTEYQTEDAMERLIGSFEKKEPGILASRMRSSPYACVLLDEFEKADKKVIDLFLQILDEGYFSDAFSERVNMRNTIIVATSNAGSQMIWRFVESGIDPTEKKSQIIAEIQQEGKFKPELLNRFDGIIVFQPLSQEHLKQVARIMLKKLAERLREQQDMTFSITDEIVEEIVRRGYDPTFGARPMRRFIQDKIEKIIAEKIIKGELARGQTFSLTAQDLA
ncbi:MAG: ATP-dependent Clp protease ATP-binding subunit [Candidatus Sungbacteria bacterium]|nr:ATP-dependent Clp protease ATP-binding subunit [bacterium]MDZ4285930.1 ATP-dependent Clp protease ATP-binding subunit [Candidatus Sungbacteria bacterium]